MPSSDKILFGVDRLATESGETLRRFYPRYCQGIAKGAMMEEVWKPIPNSYPYEASNIGRVRNSKTGRILKPYPARLGYMLIGLYVNKKRNVRQLHRVIAETFIPTNDLSLEVNHKNGIHDDNRVCNLEWCTRRENVLHAVHVLGVKVPEHKQKYICVETGEIFDSGVELVKSIGCTRAALYHHLSGRQKTLKKKHYQRYYEREVSADAEGN